MTGWKDAPRWVIAFTCAAIALGAWARFKGLGTWPFGVDEYYISRSIDFILMSGLPEYPCGGYYQRGILYQYIVAGLRLLEMTPELSARIVPAVTSFAVLPAAWLLGRRLSSPLVGWLAVAVLALSVWEIEMARFARMYIPFQAVFAWYLLFFLRFAVDRDQRAAVPMLLLSVLGVLTWEGGVLLAATNLLPALVQHQNGQIGRRQWFYILASMPVNALLAVVTFTNLRYLSEVPPLPDDPVVAAAAETASATLGPSLPLLLAAAALPLLLTALSLPWIWSLRRRWVAAAGLLLVALAAAASQLLLAGGVLLVLLLLRLVEWQELRSRGARPFVGVLLAGAACWSVVGVIGGLRAPDAGATTIVLSVIYQVAGFPDVATEIVRPWAGTQPLVTLLLGLGLVALAWRSISGRDQRADIAVLVALIVVMALAVGASDPPRHETRYAFFLYPLLVVLALTALAMAGKYLPGRLRSAPSATALCALLLFAASEDFRPAHIATIDSESSNFREKLSGWQKNHLYPRYNFTEVARWLEANATEADVVVTGVPPIPQYYAGVDYSFMDEEDDRYFAFACTRGTVDRWSNLPLLYPTDALAEVVAGGQRVFIVLFEGRAERLVQERRRRGWNVRTELPTRQQDIAVVVVN